LERVARKVVTAADPLPVTAKIRIGWDASSINASTTARILEDTGVRRIAVHGRTKAQGYSGQADWDQIAKVASSVKIPVIGNGDIDSPETAMRRMRESGVSGLMIGRAAMQDPAIFASIRASMRGQPVPHRTPADRWSLALRHCAEEIRWRGEEEPAMRSMRSRLMAYARGIPGGARLRERLARVSTLAGLEDLVADYVGSSRLR
jgi:tRNA-dihydrouridine synthase B